VWAGSIAVNRSKKDDKRIASGTYRTHANQLLRTEGEEYIERSRHEFKYGDNWTWGCDGTAFWGTVKELVAFEEGDPRWIHKTLAK
jgi:hypothetical protein